LSGGPARKVFQFLRAGLLVVVDEEIGWEATIQKGMVGQSGEIRIRKGRTRSQ